MNFFFSINNFDFYSRLNIPRFQNSGKINKNNNLYMLNIENGAWKVENLKAEYNSDFYFVDKNQCNNENIFFLASDKEVRENDNFKVIKNLNNFTDTKPAFRANLEICKVNGGLSSYQSEYPIKMIEKKGSVLSSIDLLTNYNAENNYIIFKNIYSKPIREKFEGYFIDKNNKKIIEKIELITNFTNFIKINNKLIGNDYYFFTKEYTGIPIFLSEDNGHLSFEHTHPPHEYILTEDKFKRVANMKKEFYEITN